jgi:general secretion pathway protein G
MVEIVRRLIVSGITLGVIAGNADEIKKFYDETVSYTRQLATAGDLRTITNMLDYRYMKRGRYPKTKHFKRWMEETFKENPQKEFTVDHWGNPLIYRATSNQKGFVLVSSGPDGVLGTLDDLKYTGP